MLRFASNPRNVAKVDSFVEKVVNRYKLSPDTHGNILISLTEAVTNAIRHGNKNDENKKVEVKMEKSANKLSIRVCDEGHGFDYNSLPDPTQPCNRAKCGGRGVFLMRELSDRLEFLDNGRVVEMQFKI
ncbi:MAG: ATP-binding protein [Phaeodactylibacter sp.]|nr:ATP-binding protein [Phaeodactylibacter sp.]